MDVLGGSREVGVVDTCRVLHAHRDAIVACSTLSKVIRLKVEGGLREAISVRKIMDRVHDVECVHNCRVDVRRGGWRLGKIIDVDEVTRRGLGRRSGAFSCEDVVATTRMSGYRNPGDKNGYSRGHSRGHCPVIVPTEGRRSQILGVGEDLETLRGDLLIDWENEVLHKERKEKENG